MKVAFSTSEFMGALREYVKACNKDMAFEINKTARNIAWLSIGKTKQMTDKWPVLPSDSPKRLRKFGDKATKLGKFRARKGTTSTNSYKDKFYFAKAAEKGAKKGQGITAVAQKLWANRRIAKGYTSAAWAPAVVELGGKVNAKLMRFYKHAGSKRGGAKKATATSHVAKIMNTAGGSEVVGYDPMVHAGQEVFADRINHIRESIAKRAREASGRKR